MIHKVADIRDITLETNKKRSIIIDVDGNKMVNKEVFFSFISKELNFPDYFGKNWDALDECLHDLEWLDISVNQILIIVRNSDNILAEEKISEKEILTSCLNDASDFWDGLNDEFGYKNLHPNLVLNVYYVEE